MIDAPEVASRRSSRLLDRHAPRDPIRRFTFDVMAHLGLHPLVAVAPRQERAGAMPESVEHAP
jgi:hypothetical protein